MTRINTAVGTQRVLPTSSQPIQEKRPDEAAKPAARDEFKASAQWAKVKLHDASARSALRRLEKTAGREVSAAELYRALKAGSADVDGQFTKKEFKDFSAWALRNAGRLTDGAKKVMSLYAKTAKAAHGQPLSSSEYSELMRDLSGVKEPKKPEGADKPDKPQKRSVLDDPERWFVSQKKTKKYNSREDDGDGNCGPTSLTMIAKAFGKVRGGAGKMDAAIERTRDEKMDEGTNENLGTDLDNIEKGARRYGLKAREQTGRGKNVTRRLDDAIGNIKDNLAKGRPVIVHGVMIRSENDPRRSKYGDGGHYFVVTDIKKNKQGKWVAHLNDPNWPDGPRTVPLSRLRESIRRRGTFKTLAVWDE
jgi:hypothetical protein